MIGISVPVANRAPTGGFTLVEMLIAMVCFAMLLAIVGPKFYQITGRYRVDEATTMVATDLRQAVSLAARRQKPIGISLEGTSRYVLKDRANSPADTVRLRRNLTFATDIGPRTLSFSPATVTVYPIGIVDQAFTVTLTSDGYSRQVTLSPAGQVRVVAAP